MPKRKRFTRMLRAPASLPALAVLLVLALGACTTAGGPSGGGDTGPAAAPDDTALSIAPSFDLATIDGKRISSQAVLGKPTLVTFAASW